MKSAGAMNRKSKGAPGSTVRKKRGRSTTKSGLLVKELGNGGETILDIQVELRFPVKGRNFPVKDPKFHFGTYHTYAEAHAARDFCTFFRDPYVKSEKYTFHSILTIFEEFEETHGPLRESYMKLLNLQNSVPRAVGNSIKDAFYQFNNDARKRLKLMIEEFKKRYPYEFMSFIPAVPVHLEPSDPYVGEVKLSGERGRILLREADCLDPATNPAILGLNLLNTRYSGEQHKQLLDLLNDVGWKNLAQIILRSNQCLPCQASQAERVNNQERRIIDPIVLVEDDIFRSPLRNCEVDPREYVDLFALVDEPEANLSGLQENLGNDSWQSKGLAGTDGGTGGSPLLGNQSPAVTNDSELHWTDIVVVVVDYRTRDTTFS